MNLDASISTIMSSEVATVTPEQKLIDIKHIYEKPDFHSHIPVIDDNGIIGMVSLIDFMRSIHDASLDDTEEVYHELTVKDIMTLSPTMVEPGTSIREVIEILSKGQFHSMLIATDKQLEGIVTTTDILKKLID